jgi:hypothetical protein
MFDKVKKKLYNTSMKKKCSSAFLTLILVTASTLVAGCERTGVSAQTASPTAASEADRKEATNSEQPSSTAPTTNEPSSSSAPKPKETINIIISNRGFNGVAVYAAAALPSSEIGHDGSCEWTLYNGTQTVVAMVEKAVDDSRNATCPSPEFPKEELQKRGVSGEVNLHLGLNYESDTSKGSATTDPFQVKL